VPARGLDYWHQHGTPFFTCMVLEQAALSGTYCPGKPLPQGSDRAKYYNSLF